MMAGDDILLGLVFLVEFACMVEAWCRRRAIRSACGAMWSFCRSCMKKADSNAAFDDSVKAELHRIRCKLLQHYLTLGHIMLILLVMSVHYSVTGKGKGQWMSLSFNLIVVVACLLDVARRFIPRLNSTEYGGVWYAIIMAFALATMLPQHQLKNTNRENWALTIFLLVRLPVTVATSKMSLVIICNGAFTLMSLFQYEVDSTKSDISGSPLEHNPFRSELVQTLAGVIAAWVLEAFLAKRVRNEMRVKQTSVHLGAATSLLATICDAVVQLDPKLQLSCDSSQLSSLLMRQSTASLQGRSILDFLPSTEERARVSLLLNPTTDASEEKVQDQKAFVFETHLLDSCNNKVGVECFGVRFQSLSGGAHYLLGFREDPGTKALPA